MLESRRNVDGVSGNEGATFAWAPDHDLTGVHADANSLRRTKEFRAAGTDSERGVKRALRMIFLTGRRTESGEHRVAHELLERTAGRLDRLGGSVVIALEQCARPLRILLAQLRRSDEVDEEDRRQLPLGHRRRQRCRRRLNPPPRRSPRSGREVEVRLVTEDRLLEIQQHAARLETELVDERAPRLLVDGERIGLPPRPVEREHERRAQSFAKRVLANERLKLPDHAGLPTKRELGLDSLLERLEVHFLEPEDLPCCEAFGGELAERSAPPERERFAKSAQGILRR